MGRHRVRIGDRSRARGTVASAAPEPLAAAAVVDSFEWTRGGPGYRTFVEAALAAGYDEYNHASWPCEEQLEDHGQVLFREPHEGVFQLGDLLVHVEMGGGWAGVEVASKSREKAADVLAVFQAKYPPLYHRTEPDRLTVPITFWAYGSFGPSSRLRLIDAAGWEDITGNYTAAVKTELDRLMSPQFVPGKDGQLILWFGPPGTGKTWALRALASQWRPWAEFHYILDPDRFFGAQPDYMRDVLLADTYDELVTVDGETSVAQSEAKDGKWRVLILEDTGELLSADAKDTQGQGLSRLLNVVDGMVGQGLRVLAIVTTNDEIASMHPAVVRPGRCASKIEFGPLSAEEASAFLGETVEEGGTLAELYARQNAGSPAFTDEPVEAVAAAARILHRQAGLGTSRPVIYNERALDVFARAALSPAQLAAAGAEDDEPVAEIKRVAEAHQEEAVGYGETAWNAGTGTVLYCAGDWTDVDPIEADFLAITGVNGFEYEMEALPEGWWDAEVVYPENPPRWVTERPGDQAAIARLAELAAAPLLDE